MAAKIFAEELHKRITELQNSLSDKCADAEQQAMRGFAKLHSPMPK